jgi:hypothetical protein
MEFNSNRWFGTVSTDFAIAGNWSAGSVPLDEASIVLLQYQLEIVCLTKTE